MTHYENVGNGIVSPAERNIMFRYAYLELETELADTTDPVTCRRLQRRLDAIGSDVVNANLGLIYKIARRFKSFTGDGDDYVAVSSLGFWEAFTTWDPNKGSLTHWAWQICEGRVRRAVAADEHPGSYTAWCNRPQVRAAHQELSARLGREATADEIAEHLGMTSLAVQQALAARPLSLEAVTEHVELVGSLTYQGDDLLDMVAGRVEDLTAAQLVLLLRTRGEDGVALDGGPLVSINAASQHLGLNREGGRERLAKALDVMR